jgi:hypothetical protein
MDPHAGTSSQEEPTTGRVEMSHTDGTSSSTAATNKSKRKPRDLNKLHEGIISITEVGPKGEPVSLADVAKTYSKMLCCIWRNTIQIGCQDLAGKREKLLDALHHSYEFSPDYKEKAEKYAISKWPKMFRDWKSRANCTLKAKDFEIIKRLNPNMDPNEWKTFCESSKSKSSKEISNHFRDLRSKLLGSHHLGPGGYKAAESKWAKEAADFEAAGKPPPFSEHRDHARDFRFLRARAVQDPGTKELVLPTPELRSTEENLVTSITTHNLLPNTFSTFITVYHDICIFCREI